MTLNEKIIEILKKHPEGRDFFDALDAMIRGDLDIISAFMNFVENTINTKEYTLVLTGQFGNSIINIFGKVLYEKFDDVIIVNGGIRSGVEPVIIKQNISSYKCILLDDSFYSGLTCYKINSALKSTINSRINIEYIFVVYDGSKSRKVNVFSMFRYFKENE